MTETRWTAEQMEQGAKELVEWGTCGCQDELELSAMLRQAAADLRAREGQIAEAEAEGRLAVRQELTEAVRRFSEDDSMGIGQLIEVIEPWLLDKETP